MFSFTNQIGKLGIMSGGLKILCAGCALMALAGCIHSNSSSWVSNVDSTFYSHNISIQQIPVVYVDKTKQTDTQPSRLIFEIPENIMHEGKLIIPRNSRLAALVYYKDSPHVVVELIQLAGNMSWTPAQGVITRTTEKQGFASLSHLTIPK